VTYWAQGSRRIAKLFTRETLLQRHFVLLATFPEKPTIDIEHRQRF